MHTLAANISGTILREYLFMKTTISVALDNMKLARAVLSANYRGKQSSLSATLRSFPYFLGNRTELVIRQTGVL